MATKLEAYPEYKTSGIDWLGEIPSHWEMCKIKHRISMVLGKMLQSKKTQEDGYSLEKYLKSRNVSMLELSELENLDEMWFSAAEKSIYLLKEGDVVMNEGGDIGKVALWQPQSFSCYLQNSVHKLTPNGTVNSSFLTYYLASISFVGFFQSIVSQISIAHLTKEKLANAPLIVPSYEEQEQIAAYLDDVTGKIDELVKEKQAQLDDIRAYRTSLITETVTRGLNPNAPLKDSGIDWLGEIPEHWEIVKLAWLASVQTGTTPSTSIEKYWINTTKNWFTPGDFDGFEVKDSKRKVSAAAYNEIACRVFPPYTIYLVGIGATLGKVAYCKTEASANQQINAITFKEDIYPIYGLYYLSSINQVIKAVSNSATLPILNQEQTKDLQFLVPPLSEQKEIADFLDAKTSKIDALIDELNKQIEELAEYKRAVITEAVTGKVDVRDWKPKA